MTGTDAQAPQLRRGAVGWVLLASLGISYVIAGHYAAWNFGLDKGGWGGMLVAVAAAALMYFALIFALAELAALMPESGGGYAFVRRAFGPRLAFVTGIAILIEYVAASAVIAIFAGAYAQALLHVGGPWLIVGLFVVFTALHASGVGEALKVLLLLTVVAVLGLVVFIATLLPGIDWGSVGRRLAAPSAAWFPHGWAGVWTALPFATAFFLAVEGVPMAAEEARDPARTIPRAMRAAMIVLCFFGTTLVVVGPAAAGLTGFVHAEDPLVYALAHTSGPASRSGVAVIIVNVCALVALLACFFSALFASSRQVFALARAGLLPRAVGHTSSRFVPVRALIATSVIACAIALSGASEPVFVMMVCAGTASYLPMLAAHLVLRVREPQLPRPYRTPGGVATVVLALAMAALCFIACVLANFAWSLVTCAVLAAAIGGYRFTRAAAADGRAASPQQRASG